MDGLALFGESEQFFAQKFAVDNMRDFEVIRFDGDRFLPHTSTEIHRRCRDWLEQKLSTAHKGPTVVVTHHAPSSMSVSTRYKTDPLSPAFASRLEAVMEEFSPNLWIHGHTHDAFDYEIYSTRVVCNPRGYPGEAERCGFNQRFVAEV